MEHCKQNNGNYKKSVRKNENGRNMNTSMQAKNRAQINNEHTMSSIARINYTTLALQAMFKKSSPGKVSFLTPDFQRFQK